MVLSLKINNHKKYIFLLFCVFILVAYKVMFAREVIWTKDMDVKQPFYYLAKWKDNAKPILHTSCEIAEYFLVDDNFLRGVPVAMTCNHKKEFTLTVDKVSLVGEEIAENEKLTVDASFYVTGVLFNTEAFRTPNMGAEKQIELRLEGHGKDIIYIYKVDGQRAIPERLDSSW